MMKVMKGGLKQSLLSRLLCEISGGILPGWTSDEILGRISKTAPGENFLINLWKIFPKEYVKEFSREFLEKYLKESKEESQCENSF